MGKFMNLFHLFCTDEKGGGLVEYALIIGLIAAVSVTAMKLVGVKINVSMILIKNVL